MAKSTRKTTNVVTMPKPVSTTPEQSPSMNPTDMDIAKRAFGIYCERGCQDGCDVEDWLQAERELRDTAKSTAA
jgi:Protein of unknown function (DUF2934)